MDNEALSRIRPNFAMFQDRMVVFYQPLFETARHTAQRNTQRGQTVFNPWRDFWMTNAINETIALQFT